MSIKFISTPWWKFSVNQTNKQTNYYEKQTNILLAGLLAVFNLNAIEIVPQGVVLKCPDSLIFIINLVMLITAESGSLNLDEIDYASGPVSACLDS